VLTVGHALAIVDEIGDKAFPAGIQKGYNFVFGTRESTKDRIARGSGMLTSPMTISTRRVIRVFPIFLAAAIFLWGLQAKLALYKPPSSVRAVSVAKLIASKQQILYITKKNQPPSSKVIAIASCIALKVVLARRAAFVMGQVRRIGKPVFPPIHLSDVPSFLRPPPSFA